jgi:hypothetical protein
VNFAVMKDGTGKAELTVWPAFGIWRGAFDETRPAVSGMLDQLAGAGVGTDWGARMLSNESELYEPLSYNNGAVWPFLTEFAALALYRNHRAPAAWAYLDGTADLTFMEARGYIAELFSGDRLRSVDAAVPHQLFATTGFVSTLLRGMLGIDSAARTASAPARGSFVDGRMRLAPQLPPGWPYLRLRNLRWRGAIFDFAVERTPDLTTVRVMPRAGSAPLSIEVTLPPGAEPLSTPGRRQFTRVGTDASRGVRLALEEDFSSPETIQIRHRPGIQIATINEPLRLGDDSRRLRIIDARLEAGTYSVRLQGRRGRTYRVTLDAPFAIQSLTGAREVSREGSVRTLEVTMPAGAVEWPDVTLQVRLGARTGK